MAYEACACAACGEEECGEGCRDYRVAYTREASCCRGCRAWEVHTGLSYIQDAVHEGRQKVLRNEEDEGDEEGDGDEDEEEDVEEEELKQEEGWCEVVHPWPGASSLEGRWRVGER